MYLYFVYYWSYIYPNMLISRLLTLCNIELTTSGEHQHRLFFDSPYMMNCTSFLQDLSLFLPFSLLRVLVFQGKLNDLPIFVRLLP